MLPEDEPWSFDTFTVILLFLAGVCLGIAWGFAWGYSSS